MPVFKTHIVYFFILLFGFNYTQAQFGKAVFHDIFEDNKNDWPIESSEALTTHIEHGRYVLDKKTPQGV